ncbi:MAG: YjjG family noncanonical pyrimidine nucleotidase [Candidatus Tenebribacter burtonii]|jgi:putative hydrolase of the HAD superfamily|nr:YjjG family noncanonical pyrimidine nucleotidase [Candidatus Tenebribacter burtonii]
MKYKLVLFDADGTLYDFTRTEREAFEKTLRQFGIHENLSHLHKEYEKINLAIWKEFEKKKIDSIKLRLERFSRFFKQEKLSLDPKVISPIYLKYLSEGTHLLDGAEEIVKYFYGKCKLALATNGLADVQNPRFADSRLIKYFKYIFISEEIGSPKPNKKYFQHIFDKLPYKDSAIIIGDNLSSDIKGGSDFGIDTCWFNPNKRINENGVVPTYEISNLVELKKILG